MWSNIARESEWEAAERELISDAVRDTEDEIFTDVTGSPDARFRDDNNDLVDQMSEGEDWFGNPVPLSEEIRESLGEIEPGTAGLSVSEREHALARQVNELHGMLNNVAQNLPQPERPDMFADPDAWEQNLLAQHRGEGGIALQDYGRETPNKPDMWSDPAGYERWMLSEMNRRSGLEEHNTQRLNASLGNAHRIHGADFEQAFSDITSMNPRDRRSREAVQTIISSADPGSAVMQVWGALQGANFIAKRTGGAPFAPMLRSSMRSPHEGSARRSRGWYDDAEEHSPERELSDQIFDSIWD
jgi:hypothetical protein